jgi:CBS domain-containing membrane protein
MNLVRFMGVQTHASLGEKVLSTIGGIISIGLIFYISSVATGLQGAMAILPSMGASVVLLFAVPHGTLSQPWPLFGGHLLSAIIGVSCALLIGNIYLSAALAVGLAIAMMHLCRCIHPPGGATALAAVIGGESLRSLGYSFLISPTLINCVIIFIAALAFNNMFAWRRYPSSLIRYEKSTNNPETKQITAHHIQQAMETLDEIIDIEPEQIKYIVDKADEIMRSEKQAGFHIEVGAFYTNGKAGLAWSVRQVVDVAPHQDDSKYSIIYRTVDGADKNQSGTTTLREFSDWAKEKMRPVQKQK